MKECICPIINIKCTHPNHVSEEDMRNIAYFTFSMVRKECINGSFRETIFGPHRTDCPCHPNYKV